MESKVLVRKREVEEELKRNHFVGRLSVLKDL